MVLRILVFVFLFTDVFTQQTDMMQVLHDQCKKAGGEEDLMKVMLAHSEFERCLSPKIVINEFNQQLMNAIKNNDLNDFFKKNCAYIPHVQNCLHSYIETINKCKFASADVVTSIESSSGAILDYICFENGVRIKNLYSEPGLKCVSEKETYNQKCAGNSMNGLSSLLENLKTTAGICSIFDSWSTCIISNLEQCSDSTASDTLKSLYSLVHEKLSCNSAMSIGMSSTYEYILGVFMPLMLIVNYRYSF